MRRFLTSSCHQAQQMPQTFPPIVGDCQPCRYRGISFLKFLLSRERDLEAYGAKRRARRQRRLLIEVYPKGFIPPHLTTLRKKKGQESDTCGEHIDQRRG
jgi:hypothetical protein